MEHASLLPFGKSMKRHKRTLALKSRYVTRIVNPVTVVEMKNCSLATLLGLQRNLNLSLLIFKALILWSRVDGGIPSLAAAPDVPETRPRHAASAASMISRSLMASGSPLKGAKHSARGSCNLGSFQSQDPSIAKVPSELRMTDRSITFCNSRIFPGQS